LLVRISIDKIIFPTLLGLTPITQKPNGSTTILEITNLFLGNPQHLLSSWAIWTSPEKVRHNCCRVLHIFFSTISMGKKEKNEVGDEDEEGL